MAIIDHVDLVVSDLARSLPFYRGLLFPLGWTDAGDIVGEQGERVTHLRPPGGHRGLLGLRAARTEGPHDRYRTGLHHLAFLAEDRAAVDDRHAWALAFGARIEDAPREYSYTPGYYGLFLRDPDDLKLEVMHRT